MKPVFGVSNKMRLKPARSATETCWKIKISLVASLDMIFFNKRTSINLLQNAANYAGQKNTPLLTFKPFQQLVFTILHYVLAASVPVYLAPWTACCRLSTVDLPSRGQAVLGFIAPTLVISTPGGGASCPGWFILPPSNTSKIKY